MTDARELDGLDPYAILDAEAERIDRFLSALPDGDPAWEVITGCPAWTRRDMIAHLAAAEEYHHACFDDALGPLFERFLAAGASDLHGFNALGVSERAGRTPSEVLDEWRRANGQTRASFRERGDHDMATSVGAYPARWQAFHVASELATHADDLGVPVADDEAEARLRWRARFSRFALMEAKPDVTARAADGGTEVTSADGTITVDDVTFVQAVAGRAPDDVLLDDVAIGLLSTMP
jgi:uncharacterized protein (TIGR03083 family)